MTRSPNNSISSNLIRPSPAKRDYRNVSIASESRCCANYRGYNPLVARRTKAEQFLRPFKGSGRLRERGSYANWFSVEFLIYHDDRGKLRSFAYVRREDGGDIPDGHYVFLDELGERSFRWRKLKGKWQFGWRYRGD
jgi:hypothetical protein